jgi:hypothetical protein
MIFIVVSEDGRVLTMVKCADPQGWIIAVIDQTIKTGIYRMFYDEANIITLFILFLICLFILEK